MALKYNQNLRQNLKKKDGKKKLPLWPLLVEEIGSDLKSFLRDGNGFKLH